MHLSAAVKTGIDFVASLNRQYPRNLLAKVTTPNVKLLGKKIVIYDMAKEILEKNISFNKFMSMTFLEMGTVCTNEKKKINIPMHSKCVCGKTVDIAVVCHCYRHRWPG